MMKNFNFSATDIASSWPVRITVLTALLNIILLYFLEGGWVPTKIIAFAIIGIGLISYIIKDFFAELNYVNMFIIASGSYFIYSLLMTFTKLSESILVLKNELNFAVSFGALSLLVYYLMRKFSK